MKKPSIYNLKQAKPHIDNLIANCRENDLLVTIEPNGANYDVYWDRRRFTVKRAACEYLQREARVSGVLAVEAPEGWGALE